MTLPDCVQAPLDMISTQVKAANRGVRISRSTRSLLDDMASLITSSPTIEACMLQVVIKATTLEDTIYESLFESNEVRTKRAECLQSLKELETALIGVKLSEKANILRLG